MKKSEIFDIVAGKVCEVCEITPVHLYDGCKVLAVVDARILAVQYLRRIGLSCEDIALLYLRRASGNAALCPSIEDIRRKAKAIQKQFEGYSQRCLESFAFCLMSAEISDFCRDKYAELYAGWMKSLPPRK